MMRRARSRHALLSNQHVGAGGAVSTVSRGSPALMLGARAAEAERTRFRALERQDRADALLALHRRERLVDVVEREAARDERLEVDLALEIGAGELGDAVAALGAAEGRAGDPAAGDEVA